MTAPHSPPRPDDTTRKIDLNLPHVAAAALAAVTAAVLGSRVGTAGTLIGAAGASVITTVGTAVYKASLERSRERVRTLARRTRSLPTSREGRRTGPSHRFRRCAMLGWGAVVVGALGAFVVAMMVITGFEWASGKTVGGNGKGTTIGQVVTDQPSPRQPATSPEPSPPAGPVSETPTAPATSTTTPDGGLDVERSPTTTSGSPSSSEVTPTPPLIPPGIPGIGG